jgi:hypothetical protein
MKEMKEIKVAQIAEVTYPIQRNSIAITAMTL